MKIYIVIPAHNEEEYLPQALLSLAEQTLLPKSVVVVNDASTDGTLALANSFSKKHPWLKVVSTKSEPVHQPGAKVIRAFNEGLAQLDEDFDILMKLDADILLPKNYLETIARHFNSNPKIGMAAGFACVEKEGNWVVENLTDADHIRGALKAYRKECFSAIGGLREAMGWDTLDEILARYFGWEIKTDSGLLAKHLKPTGERYQAQSGKLQGKVFYTLRYGLFLTKIAALKLAWRKKSTAYFFNAIRGYFSAWATGQPKLLTKDQGEFLRKYRREKIIRKIFN
jgi:glycosyltransferase involved in cell wall biosynthesis